MKVQEEINAEKAHLDKAQEDVLQESQCFEDEGIHLGFHREELSMIQQRRYRSRLPVRMDPQALFQTPRGSPLQTVPGASTGRIGAGETIPQLA